MSSEFDEKDNIDNLETQAKDIDSKEEPVIDEGNSFDDMSVIDISSDVEYKLNQERSGIEVVKLSKNKTQRNVNSFDLFFIRLWASIVSAVTFVSQGICKGFFKVFKKELPEKYVTAAIAFLLIILLIIIVLAPFNLTVGEKNTVEIFSNSLIPVRNSDGLWGYADKHGKAKIACQYVDANPFYNGVAFVKMREGDGSNYWTLIDTKGKRKGDLKIKEDVNNPSAPNSVVGDFNNKEKLAWVYDSGQYYFIKTNGKRAFTSNKDAVTSFAKAESFSDGYALVVDGSNHYFINKHNKRISPNYDDAMSFTEGLAAVYEGGSWFFVDTDFRRISETYYKVTQFKNGYAWVRKGKTSDYTVNLIDKKGNKVMDMELDKYSSMKPSDEELRQLEIELFDEE